MTGSSDSNGFQKDFPGWLLQSELPSGVVNVPEGVHFPSLLKPVLSVRFWLEGITGASSRRDTT
ncbi:MAG: hypothetical protein ACKOF3_13845 [Spartobacteria bacterium]